MTQEEEYIHFVSSLQDLQNAWSILQDIRQTKDCLLIAPAFRSALIEYCKPYKDSCVNSKDRHKLDERFIPEAYLELHERIIDARDQILAHSDLTVRDAKLYVQESKQGRTAVISQNILDSTEEYSNIDAIISLIEKTIDRMLEEETRMVQKLLPNS